MVIPAQNVENPAAGTILENSNSTIEMARGHETTNHNHDDDNMSTIAEPPEGGYGWICVIGMLLITAMTWGVNGAYGVYLAYYLISETFPNAKNLDYAFIGGIMISQITFIAPLVTWYYHHFGRQTCLLTGVILETGALVAASFATQIWHIYLTQGLLFGWGCSFLYVGATPIIPQWFERRRGLANGIAAAGSGLGGLIWSLATGAMIKNIGVPWSFRITAIVTCVVNIICSLLMKDRNKLINPNKKAFDVSLFARYEFQLLLGWGFFSMLGYTILLFSLPDYGTRIGLTQDQAAIVGAMVNLGMAVGRPIVGYFSDSVGRINMATAATFFGALVSFFIWTFAKSYGVLILASILAGTVCGTFWAMIGTVTTEVLGVKELPSALSIIWTSVVFPCLFAEPIALELQGISTHASYRVQIFTGFMFLGGTFCMILLRSFQVSQLTEKTHNDDLKAKASVFKIIQIANCTIRRACKSGRY